MSQETQYLELLKNVLENGESRENRTKINTLTIFSPPPLKFNIQHDIPLFTTKKMAWRTVIKELLWFLRGDTDAKILQKENVKIWDLNTSKEFLKERNLNYSEGILGPGYGWQWRRFGAKYSEIFANISKFKGFEFLLPKGVDQIEKIEKMLTDDPYSRRIILTAWNPTAIDATALPPCHCFVQFYVSKTNKLSAHVYCRSQDLFLGTCFNVFSYSVLLSILAKRANLIPFELTFSMGDAHIYDNHIPLVKKQIENTPYKFPKLHISDTVRTKKFSEITIDDFVLHDYKCHHKLGGEMVA